MNSQRVFPKKLAIFGFLVLLLVFGLNIFSIFKTSTLLQQFKSNDVPAIQMSCAATRLMTETSTLLSSSNYNKNETDLQTAVLSDSINEILNFTKSVTTEGEQFEKRVAYQQFTSNNFNQLETEKKIGILSELKVDLQTLIESYLLKKNELIEKNLLIAQITKLTLIIGFSFLLFIMILIYHRYQTNLKNIELLTHKLEQEKVTNMHSSKLASLGEMVAGLAHEINNPLSVILGRSEILIDQLAGGTATNIEINKTVTKTHEMATRISKIITSMRKIAKSSDKEEVRPINLYDAIQDVLNLSSEKMKINSIALDITSLDKNQNAMANFTYLTQVLINLLNNSIDELLKIDLDKRFIRIKTSHDSNFVYMSITDGGSGIPEAIRSKLFEPFFTTKEVGKGTGLGLSISKSLMKNIGGDIYLDEKSSNTTFVLKMIKA